MKIITILPLAIMLSACASINSQQIELTYSRCPVLKKYTQQELMQAAKEVANLPNESQIEEMMADYSKLRDACRLSEKELKKQR
jgi:Tfp pilus assembly protein PilP